MDVEQLVRDLKVVRRRGVPRTSPDEVPALMHALALYWPDRSDSDRRHALEEFLDESAARLGDHYAEGVRIALGIGAYARDSETRRPLSSAERREAFAAYFMSFAETVRRRGNLEDQVFTTLARAIARPLESATGAASTGAPAGAAPSLRATVRGPASARPRDGTTDERADARRAVVREADRHLREAEQRGQWERAALWSAAVVEVMRWPADDSPDDHELELASRCFDAGRNFLLAGRVDEAREQILKAEQISQTLLDLEPENNDYRLLVAAVLTLSGTAHMSVGRLQEAEAVVARAVVQGEWLVSQDPDDADFAALLALPLTVLGILYSSTDQEQRAADAYSRAVAHLQQQANGNPDDAGYRALLAMALTMLGMLHTSADREAEAENALVHAVALLQQFVGGATNERPDSLTLATASFPSGSAKLLLAQALLGLGFVYLGTDREQDAQVTFLRAVAILEELIDEDPLAAPVPKPVHAGARILLPLSLYALGVLYRALEHLDDAENALTRAVDCLRTADAPEGTETLDTLAEALDSLAEIYQETGRYLRAEEARDSVRNIRRRLAARQPDDPEPG